VTEISVLGIGKMGSAIARQLLADGHSVTVWNRTPGKTGELEDLGAELAPDAATAIAASPVSVLTVLDYHAAVEILPGPSSLTGKDIVNLASGGAAAAISFDTEIAMRGGRLLEGIPLCYPSQIGSAEAVLRYSGSQEAWENHRGTLRSLANESAFLGPSVELANVVDEIGLAFSTPILIATMEAAAYAETHGLSFSMLLPQFLAGFSVIGEFLTTAVKKIADNDFTGEETTLDVYLASIAGVASSMKAAGIDARVLEATQHQMRAARDAAGADADVIAVYSELLRNSRANDK